LNKLYQLIQLKIKSSSFINYRRFYGVELIKYVYYTEIKEIKNMNFRQNLSGRQIVAASHKILKKRKIS